ncbi:MAG: DUF4215 domain-containing protein [Deltaproteobacteria bacterium]|nr:DUF4215 domain-containing protein [Deltaproteobacteria bacterium]
MLPVGQTSLCPGAEIGSARLIWELRGQAGTGGTIPMTLGGDRFRGSIPPQPAGAVVRYRIELALASGDVTSLPNNAADPMYEMFIGPVTPIYCTDFESDPTGAGGWTHRLVSGSAREGADDWQWGQPDATVGSGDPGAAHSGQMVMGNDLGGGNFNGLYQSGKVNELASPSIDVSGYSNVRLQYWRWLNVEDGFFDKAQIVANGEVVWSNLATDAQGSTHHTDHEWRFQDVDLSAQAATGAVQVAFRIGSDAGLEFGGWTIDDFCVVSYGGATAVCGNGVLDSGEQCDDGNTLAGDGCEPTCVPSAAAICGDGVVQAGEQCDDGNGNAGDGCKPDCTADGSLCGDGVIQTGEQCDDGNTVEGDGCSARCTAPGAGGTCGDGVVDANEECDPGAAGADTCTADCHRVAGSLNEAAGGCGCSTTPSRGASLAAIGLLVGLALFGRRRRR